MTATQSNALELARQGNPKAISILINKQLQSKGVTAKTSNKEHCLKILLEATEVPEKELHCTMIEKGLRKIQPQGVFTVKMYGKSIEDDLPAWDYVFSFQEENPFSSEQSQANTAKINDVAEFRAEGKNGSICLTRRRVVISREGFWGFVSQGVAGRKEIPIKNITAVQYRAPGKGLVGYLQFSMLGSIESQGGVFNAVNDENTVAFNPNQQANFEEIKRYIDAFIDGEPIELSDLRYTDPATVEVEQPFWNKPLNSIGTSTQEGSSSPQKVVSSQRNAVGKVSESTSQKKMSAGILALILGSLGIHKFVLGYTVEGLILLGATVLSGGLLLGITFIIGLIEGILYLTKSDEEFERTYINKKRGWF